MNKTIEEILNVKLINPNNAEEIWTTLLSLGMEDLDEEYMKILNCNMYETIARGISYKMSFKEIALVFDPLNELLKGNIPRFAAIINRDQRIKVQIRYMNENGLCPNLTDEEKKFFAFCVYLMTCTNRIVDETVLYGITEFTSYEKIIDLYKEHKKTFPEFYDLDDNRDSTGDFGYTPENPIKTTSINFAYMLLNNLLYKGERISMESRASVSANNSDHIIDMYNLVTTGGSHVTIYIDSYCSENSQVLPEGFSLSE